MSEGRMNEGSHGWDTRAGATSGFDRSGGRIVRASPRAIYSAALRLRFFIY